MSWKTGHTQPDDTINVYYDYPVQKETMSISSPK